MLILADAMNVASLVLELTTLGIVVVGSVLLWKWLHNKWPMVQCPPSGEWAIHYLRDIMVELHKAGSTADDGQKAQVTVLVQACLDHTTYVPGPHSSPTHCDAVAKALAHAQAGEWGTPPNNCCISELCHGA